MTVSRTTRRIGLASALSGLVAGILVAVAPAAGATHTATPTTYQGAVYGSVATTPTADKPQSKLWHQDGAWWGLLLDSAGRVAVHELRDHRWHSTGAVVDERSTSTGDALWDGSRLYVASRTSSGALRVLRLSYDPAARSYSLDAGFPVQIAGGGSESVTIAKDSAGRLWATYTQGSKVWVAHTTTDDATWTPPFNPPGIDADVASDDISAVLAFQGKIGVMWSDQASSTFRFGVHDDRASGSTGWTYEVPLSGTNMADDHINLKTLVADSAGRVHAAIKTSQGDGGEPAGSPSIAVLTRSAGTWSSAVAGTVGDSMTRPVLLLDETNSEIYLFATAPESGGGGTIYYKKAPLSDIRFGNGRGTPFVEWPGDKVNNATTTKDPVSAATGMVVLTSSGNSRTYYHAEMALPGGGTAPADTTAPTAPTGVSATAVSSSQVDVAWSASTDDTGVAGYRVLRDGVQVAQVAGTSFSDTTVAASTTYSYTVRAYDAAGNVSADSAPATVTTPAAPSGSATIALRGATAAGNSGGSTVTGAAPAGLTAGDVLVASVAARGRPTISAPTGWSRVRYDEASTTMRKATYVKVAGASEPTSYTWSLSRAEGATVMIAAYSGVDTASPVDAVAGQVTSSSSQITAPSVTTSVDGAQLVATFGIARGADVTAPSAMTERGEASASAKYVVTDQVSDQALGAAGATGTRTATASGSADNIAHVVALRPGASTSESTTEPSPEPSPTQTADTTAPSTPSGVSATAVSASQVDVAWSASTDDTGVAGYRVLRDGAQVAEVTTTSFSDRTVAASTTYSYSVTAFDAAGNVSAASAPVSVTTPAAPEPSGAIALRGATAAGNTGGSSVTGAAPAGLTAGDVLVASVDVRGRPTITAPSGWSLVRYDEAGSTMRKATYVKVAGASESTSWTWSLSRAEGATVVVAAYSGVSTSNPVDAVGGQVNLASSSITAPSVSTSVAGAQLVGLFGIARSTDVVPPSTMTELGQATASATYLVTGQVSDEARGAAGATGTRTATASGASDNIAHLVALRPAG